MALEIAEWNDVQRVLRQTFSIWSPGLNHSQYFYYAWRQRQHPWARRHYRYLINRQGNEITGSLKLYEMHFAAGSRTFRLAGLGAVFTPEHLRGNGYGKMLMQSVLDLIRQEGFDAAYLFSDIGAPFYSRFGFQELGANEFWLRLPDPPDHADLLEAICGDEMVSGLGQEAASVEVDHIPALDRYYMWWLRRQPYAVSRAPDYWRYRLFRESYLHKHSTWGWPGLEVVWQHDGAAGGYAIIEQGKSILRILELTGSDEVRQLLWSKLIRLAILRGCERIRGWEALRPQHLGRIRLSRRTWGLPMILPINPKLELVVETPICNMLELDHL